MACRQQLTIGGDHVGGAQVVAGQAEAAHQVAKPPTQREPADAGGGDDAAGGGQPEGLGLAIEGPPRDAALDARRALDRIDADPVHRGQVDHQSTGTDSLAGDTMPAQ